MRCIENLIKGNLIEAVAGAKRSTFNDILHAAEMAHGMTIREALYTTKFLKREITWGQYCQEKHAFNETE
jgi:hypothetical protein